MGLLRRRAWLIFVVTAVGTGGMCVVYVEDRERLQEKEVPIENARAWQRGLVARVYWSEPVSGEMRKGFADTVRLLGYNYVDVDSVGEANFRIWIDSWKDYCRWPSSEGFAVPDPEPGERGSQTGAVHICRMRAPLNWNRLSDYALIKHEVAHVIAAQEHIGSGLMAEGGGGGSESFNEMEIQAMCDKINALPEPLRPVGRSVEGRTQPGSQQEGQMVSVCGSEELRPMRAGGGD